MNYKIKEIRERNGLKQSELAELVGVSTRTIQNYENGEIQPSMDKLEKISSILGVDVLELMDLPINEKMSRRQIKNFHDDIEKYFLNKDLDTLYKIKDETNLSMLIYNVIATNSKLCGTFAKKGLSDNECLAFINIASSTLTTLFDSYCRELSNIKQK